MAGILARAEEGMSKRTRRLEARVEVLEREVERLDMLVRLHKQLGEREEPLHPEHPWPGPNDLPIPSVTTVSTAPDDNGTRPAPDDNGTRIAWCYDGKPIETVWRIEGQDVYCEGDATCS